MFFLRLKACKVKLLALILNVKFSASLKCQYLLVKNIFLLASKLMLLTDARNLALAVSRIRLAMLKRFKEVY